MKIKNIALAILGIFSFFALVFLTAFEVPWFENTFNSGQLAIRSAIVGGVSGALVSYFVGKKIADGLDRVKVVLAIVLPCLVFFPVLGNLTNRTLANSTVNMEEVSLFKEVPYYSGRFGLPKKDALQWTGYYIFVTRKGESVRLTSKISMYKPEQFGNIVLLPVKTGFWGYDFTDFAASDSDSL